MGEEDIFKDYKPELPHPDSKPIEVVETPEFDNRDEQVMGPK